MPLGRHHAPTESYLLFTSSCCGPSPAAWLNQGGSFRLLQSSSYSYRWRQGCRFRRNVHRLRVHPLQNLAHVLQRNAAIGIRDRHLGRHVEPQESRLPRLKLDERLGRLNGISPGVIPEQWSQRLQANAAAPVSVVFGAVRSGWGGLRSLFGR